MRGDGAIGRRIGRLRAALSPASDLAQVEGLAAGTGLLTGDVAERRARAEHLAAGACPECGHLGEVAVIDLVDHRHVHVCAVCAHRWAVVEDDVAS